MIDRPLRIGIVAGEASGDMLGAGLIRALKEHAPDAVFEGVGGERMQAEGFTSFYPMDRLSVMGFVDPLKRLPELLRLRRTLVAHFKAEPPDVFIGIDSPDFNLGIEKRLRHAGIKTVHYVSPSVWAWRQGRVKKIARAVDLMLTLLPFEADFYKEHSVPVSFVGHPLADEYPMEPNVDAARAELGLSQNAKIIAVLPGSRSGEIKQLGAIFLEACQRLAGKYPEHHFLVPAANADRQQQIEALLADPAFSGLAGRITVVFGQSKAVMTVADLVLLASGTTALEAMLLKKPMVVAYRLSNISYRLLGWMVKTPFVALPNLLANEMLVPELLQFDATPEAISQAMDKWLGDPAEFAALQDRFRVIHADIANDASARAAEAVLRLVAQNEELRVKN